MSSINLRFVQSQPAEEQRILPKGIAALGVMNSKGIEQNIFHV